MKAIEMAAIEKPERQLTAEGTYPTEIRAVVDCGTHRGYEGKGSVRKFIMVHEVLGQTRTFGERVVPENMSFWIQVKIGDSGELRLFDTNKNRKYIETMMNRKFVPGEKFDPSELVGKKCLSKIEHRQNKRGDDIAVIGDNMPLPNGMPVADAIGPSWIYDLDKPDENIDRLAPYMVTQIQQSDERRSQPVEEEVTDGPF
jgi:hypothetical protein